jgi:hypothetical protein
MLQSLNLTIMCVPLNPNAVIPIDFICVRVITLYILRTQRRSLNEREPRELRLVGWRGKDFKQCSEPSRVNEVN